MKRFLVFLPLIALLMIYSCEGEKKINYPEAKKVDTVDVYFGTEVPDPYRWLEDDNSEETAEWVKAQNEITNAYLADIPFREAIEKRMTELWNYPKYQVPFKEGDHYFYFKNDGLQNQSVLYMQKSLDAEPEVLLDPNQFSEDGTIALASMGISHDGKLLAYGISRSGSDWNEICVMDVKSRRQLKDTIRWVKFSGIAWEGVGFYYSGYDAPEKGEEYSDKNEYHKIYYHKLGTPQSEDKVIFENREYPLRTFAASVTDDQKYLIVYESESTSGNALFIKNLKKKNAGFVQIAGGFDYEYRIIDDLEDELLMHTNYEAPKWKVVLVEPDKPGIENWKTIIPEKEEVLQGVAVAGGKLIAEYMKDATSKAYIYEFNGDYIAEMDLPGIGTMFSFNGKKDENLAFYGFTSFTFPSTIYKYDIKQNISEVYKESKIDFNTGDFETEQIFFESKDGTKVPMFLVHKKGIKKDGDNPVLLYGYGGFNVSLTPSFSVTRLTFLEQGGIYALVNLRGGGEYGEEWHEAGMKLNKQNVFDDFIGAAEYLVSDDYTKPEKIAIMGGSNGGLLVGTVMTQRPDLFGVAIPIVGVMDMLRYQHFTIGWAWASDYETSEESREMFEYLYGYSPLHNIKEGVEYPATMAVTADHDDRVVPAHTFKFMATLQEKGGGDEPYLVRIETKAGHGAGKPTSKIIEEYTDIFSFVMYNLEMEVEY
ncbi:MAG: prolyl oligopeptidase family serine peptidase [Bacteroidales bacterium]|nr:prolyl oligopeptidase family serine peptidase [Bacteroidales bacterium]MCF8399711.1 prolyl oligopeptidase family serine peptidase [Bacteroidales bacterium]